ncbi:hypothetical protein BOX15_Mlig007488g1, partial [Macrostomum lignano]
CIVKILLTSLQLSIWNSSSSPFKAAFNMQRHCTTQCCRSHAADRQFPISRDFSLESTCMPVYTRCSAPGCCLPCCYAELRFTDPDNAKRLAMRALDCQRRYFRDVWHLVFGQLFGQADADADVEPEQDAGADEDADAEGETSDAQPAAAKKKKFFKVSNRPGKPSIQSFDPPPRLDTSDSRRISLTDQIAVAPPRKASFIGM